MSRVTLNGGGGIAGGEQPQIDEDLHPDDGYWITRRKLFTFQPDDPLKTRGDHYFHSSFCDLVITGARVLCCSTAVGWVTWRVRAGRALCLEPAREQDEDALVACLPSSMSRLSQASEGLR